MSANEACPTIYGPVPSRRHGRSLGINLGNPSRKICTWGCLYCQCGHGERRRTEPEDGIPAREVVLSQLKAALMSCGPLDSVTFAGNSEPANHPEFLAIVRDVRKLKYAMRADWVLNCLSNGSELDRPEVVTACDLLDEAWLKLDCATDSLFRRLNRPVAQVGSVDVHLSRIARLKKIRIQTLVWKSPREQRVENWTEENLESLLGAYSRLQPAEVHLTTISREPAWSQLEPVEAKELERFAEQVRALGIRVSVFPADRHDERD